MAHRRGFGEFADIMLRSHLQRRNQQQDQEAQDQERQMLLQDQQRFAQDQQQRQQENAAHEAVLQRALIDPRVMQKLALSGQKLPGIDPRMLQQTPDEATGNVAGEIAKANSLAEVKTPSDVLGLTKAQPGFKNQLPDQGMESSTGFDLKGAPVQRDPNLEPVRAGQTPIEELMKQVAAKKQAQLDALPRREIQGAIQPDGSKSTLVQDPMQMGATKTEFSPQEQTGQAVDKQTALMPGAVKQAGQEAGARAAADFPWQSKLAQVRADNSLANATALDDYKRTHPKATSAQLDQRAGADHAIEMIGEVRQLEAEMNKRGLMGPLRGRGAQFAAGQIKAEDLFSNPDDAKLAAEFFSEIGFLSKLAARVHGGTRAASSPGMAAAFDKLVSGIGDESIVTGQLNSVERIMKIYQDNPGAPPLVDIPGMSAPGTPTVLDKLNQLRQQGATAPTPMRHVPAHGGN